MNNLLDQEPMKLRYITLPWGDTLTRSTGNIREYIAEQIPGALRACLPLSITLFVDPEIEEQRVEPFLCEMSRYLVEELSSRDKRRQLFVKLGLFSNSEIHAILTQLCNVQPWIIYYSKSGGLRIPPQGGGQTDAPCGVLPCSAMQNHGVAWRRADDDSVQSWLVTARKEGHDWDWDSDIGHESAHSAFAPVPIFVQTDQETLALSYLSSVKSINDLNEYHLARMSYMYLEMAVIAMRGEKRDTETGLPVAQSLDELFSFLTLSNNLLPDFGFDTALAAFDRAGGFVDVDHGNEIFEIGAPALRIIPHISKTINTFSLPTLDWYRSVSHITRV
jgi:hypothetical protein